MKSSKDCANIWKVLLGIVAFFTFSISLTFFINKLIKAYPFPLSITFLHLLTKFTIVWILRSAIELFTKIKRVELPWKSYFSEVSITGIASALDIGLSNWGFEFITISLYTMTKSTSIIFILIFGIVLKLDKFTVTTVLVVLSIAAGLFLFTYQSTQFELTGFILVLFASALSGIRWSAAQKLTQTSKYKLTNPIDVLYHTQPWMAITLLPLSFFFESTELFSSPYLFRNRDYAQLNLIIFYFFCGAILALLLECSEFFVIYHSSSLTLSIAGICKELVTLYLAATINGDQYSTVNLVGLVICLTGITLHVTLKFIKLSQISIIQLFGLKAQQKLITYRRQLSNRKSVEKEI